MSHENAVSLDNLSSPYGWNAPEDLTKERLKKLIRQIGPDDETRSGKRMFDNVIEADGRDGLLDALAELRWMQDEGDGLDLAEMKKGLRDHCKRVIKPVVNPTRREFLRSTAWGVVGTSAFLDSIAKFLDHTYQILTPAHKEAPENGDKDPKNVQKAPEENEHSNYAKTAHEIYEHYIEPYEDVLVGIALVNEGIEKRKEIWLRQIKDAALAFTKDTTIQELAALSDDALRSKIHETTSAKTGKPEWASFQFFNRLLAMGKEDLIAFVERAQKAIDEQNELDLEIDLDPAEHAAVREIFDSIRCDPRHLSASDFLETWGWVLPGLALASSGAAKIHHHHLQGNPLDSESAAMQVLRNISDPGQMMLGVALINEFNLNWKKIKLEQLADVVIDLGQRQIDWEHISVRKLGEIIDNLDEPEEKFAGIRFFNTLLHSKKGTAAVHDFLIRAKQVLDKSSAENLPDCFNMLERRIFKSFSCRPNLKDSENFLHTVGWGLPGVICTMMGATSAVDLACQAVTGKNKTFAGKIKHGLHDYLGPIEGFTISLAMINEARQQWEKFHLGQIGDAQAKMVELTKKAGVTYR